MESDNSSEILNLQILENEYNLVMQQYEQANLNLIASLKSQGVLDDKNPQCQGWAERDPSECSVNPNYMLQMCKKSCKNYLTENKNFVSLKGRTYWGISGLKEGAVDSENDCKALCSSDPLCTGATYNAGKAYCWTRSGKGDIAPGLGDDVALITEVTQNANTVQQLNDKLTELNLKIGEALNKAIPEVRLQMNEKAEKQDTLQSVYSQLLIDRKNIDSMLKEYQMIEQQYDDKTIYVEQNHSAHILWIIIAILVIIFTLKMQFFPNTKSNPIKFIFWFLFAILFAIVTMRLNSAPGFFLWGIIIVLFALMQMKIMPSP